MNPDFQIYLRLVSGLITLVTITAPAQPGATIAIQADHPGAVAASLEHQRLAGGGPVFGQIG
jgi:hypothetical protein